MSTIESQNIEFEGASLAFDLCPSLEPTQVLLVLLNGFQRPRTDFRLLRRRLSAINPGLATLALDHRGSGESKLNYVDSSAHGTFSSNSNSPCNSPFISQMARDAWRITSHYFNQIKPQKLALLGISMGGMVAQEVAYLHREISHLILISTTMNGSNSLSEWRGWPSDELSMVQYLSRYFGPEFLAKSPLIVQAIAKSMLQKNSEQQGSTLEATLQYNACRAFNATAMVDLISANTLVVTGEQDNIIPSSNSKLLATSIAKGKLITYPKSGHMLLVEKAEELVADVNAFLLT